MTDQERITKIEQSIAGLEQILNELKSEVQEIKQENSVAAQPHTPVAPAEASVVMPKPVAPQTVPKKKASSSFEDNLGGKVMGIVAAILVFVGLFLFGSLMYERLGDPARIASLFIVSFLLLGAGLFFERKHKSWFTTSLIGCGFGAVYISLFITTLYFKLFPTEVLYLLLFFWLVGIGVYVFLRKSGVVALLGQTGIAFSVIFGCIGAETKGQFTFLCFFFAVLSLLYLWLVLGRFLPQTKKKALPLIHLVAAGLNLIQLWALSMGYDSFFGKYGSLGGKNFTAGILLCFYCLFFPLFFLLRSRKLAGLSPIPQLSGARRIDKDTFPVYKAGVGSVVLFTVYQLMAWVVYHTVGGTLFESDLPHGLLLLTGLLLSFLITEVFGATGTEGRGSAIVTAVAVTFSLLIFDFPDFVHALITVVFGSCTVLAGLLGSECPVRSVLNPTTRKWEAVCTQEKGRCFEKFTSCVYCFLLLFSYQSDDRAGIIWLIAAFGLAFFAGSFFFLYKKGRTHRFADGFKIELYLFGLLHLLYVTVFAFEQSSWEEICYVSAILTLLVVCNGIAFYCGFRRKLAAPELIDTGATVVTRLVHTGLWIWGIALLHSGSMEDYPLLCLWILLLTLFLCGSGMYEQYKTHRAKTGLGIYFGLRVTLYLIAVMTAFEGIEGYVISCVLLCLAILAVLTGFPLRLAPLRIYGLCLAMLAVVKLLMIDVEHDNSMETVLCFLGAGILCFAINFIYNHVKKKFNNHVS